MNIIGYFKELAIRGINYKLARKGFMKLHNPITLTFSVTNMCQSKCKTCKIWELYLKHPEKVKEELGLDEIEKIFKSIGHIYFFNISGGEPFLRKDLPEIVGLAIKYLKPGIIHIPTNAIAPKIIEEGTNRILKLMNDSNGRVPLTIKPSLDGVGEKHDEIRGVKGNFEKVIDTVARLKRLKDKYPNLYVEIGTVISIFNMNDVEQIANFVHNEMGIESYRNEIAEQRTEFFNIGDPITPTVEEYEYLIRHFSRKIRENIGLKRRLTKITETLRLAYYDIAVKILRERRQVIPCYAGISNVHLTPYGELWPCCVLGYDKPLGNLREVDYDFGRVWNSKEAESVREFIKDGNCYCPLANQAYSNILMSLKMMPKVFMNIIKYVIIDRKSKDRKK